MWLGQAAAFYVLPALLMSLSVWDFSNTLDMLVSQDYFTSVGLLAVLFMGVQGAFVLPIRMPGTKASSAPGTLRLLAIAVSLGVVAGGLVFYGAQLLGVCRLEVRDDTVLYAMAAAPVVLTWPAFVVLRRRYRGGMSVEVSIVAAALLAGVLLAATVLGLFAVVNLCMDLSPSGGPWLWVLVGSPAVGWAVFTPLIIAFVRKGPPELQLSKGGVACSSGP